MSKQYAEYPVTVSASDLPVNESEATYYADVDRALQRIGGSVTGKAVFYKIRAHGRVLIVPYTEEYARKNTHGSKCNATSYMLPHNRKSERGERVAQVAFTGAIYMHAPCNVGPGAFPDVVLLHELVHAGRKLGNDDKHVPLTGSLAGYENEEEFFAILVENTYISETGRQSSGLRADHGNTKLAPPNDNPAVFLGDADNYKLVEKYCKQHTTVAPMIAKAQANFNPIQIYYDWQEDDIPVRVALTSEAPIPSVTSASHSVNCITLASDTLFPFDEPKPGTRKYTFGPPAVMALNHAKKVIEVALSERSVVVKGYTDSIGNDAYNKGLSQRRADAVATWLIDNKAVPKKDVQTLALGALAPVVNNKDRQNTLENRQRQAKNRRVEICLLLR